MARTRRMATAGRRRFRYLDSRGSAIRDAEKIERIEALAIPPAWKDVRISPRAAREAPGTGIDGAGRKQYRYHADFRRAQEQRSSTS